MRANFLSTLLLLTVLIFSSNYSKAQTQTFGAKVEYKGSSKKLAVMVSDVPHFGAAIQTVESLNLKENGLVFEIVVAGMLAKEIVENQELKQVIDKAEKVGAKLIICESALDMLKVDKSKLDKRIYITPNALVYMFELKDKGFNTLVL
jgi:intracellular sulfur oxidation DsrE/DsrF family protein